MNGMGWVGIGWVGLCTRQTDLGIPHTILLTYLPSYLLGSGFFVIFAIIFEAEECVCKICCGHIGELSTNVIRISHKSLQNGRHLFVSYGFSFCLQTVFQVIPVQKGIILIVARISSIFCQDFKSFC